MAMNLAEDRDEDEEDSKESGESKSPYDSISDRVSPDAITPGIDSGEDREAQSDYESNPNSGIQLASAQIPQSPLPSGPTLTGDPASLKNFLVKSILDRQNSKGVDDLISESKKDQANLESARQAKSSSDLVNNLMASFGSLSRGASAPVDNGVARMIASQNQEAVQDKQKDIDFREKLLNNIAQRQDKQQAQQDSNLTKLSNALSSEQSKKDSIQSRQDALTEKTSRETEKQINKWSMMMKDDLDPSKSRAGNFAKNQARVDNAERVRGLLDQVHNNPDDRQMHELAISTQALLSASGTPAAEQVKALVPHTLWGDAKKFQEWLTNDPTGTDQQEFVKRMRETVDREAAIASDQVRKTKLQRLSAYAKFKKADPVLYNAILHGAGMESDDPNDPSNLGGLNASSGKGNAVPSTGSNAGRLVIVNGKMHKVGADGDTLEEVM